MIFMVNQIFCWEFLWWSDYGDFWWYTKIFVVIFCWLREKDRKGAIEPHEDQQISTVRKKLEKDWSTFEVPLFGSRILMFNHVQSLKGLLHVSIIWMVLFWGMKWAIDSDFDPVCLKIWKPQPPLFKASFSVISIYISLILSLKSLIQVGVRTLLVVWWISHVSDKKNLRII